MILSQVTPSPQSAHPTKALEAATQRFVAVQWDATAKGDAFTAQMLAFQEAMDAFGDALEEVYPTQQELAQAA